MRDQTYNQHLTSTPVVVSCAHMVPSTANLRLSPVVRSAPEGLVIMKILTMILSLGLLIAVSNDVAAAPKKQARAHGARKVKSARSAKSSKKAAPTGDLKTDVSFDDSVLHGQYQTPDEALARVENEKGFGDLVGVRKHFKDRLNQASEQE